MLLNHVGIMNTREDDAVGFYKDFLGFEIAKESVVPSELSAQLFSISVDIKVVVFQREGIKIEVFVSPEFRNASPDIMHIGLLIDNLQEMLEKASQAGVEVIKGETTEKTVYFLRDFSGNLLEVKQK